MTADLLSHKTQSMNAYDQLIPKHVSGSQQKYGQL